MSDPEGVGAWEVMKARLPPLPAETQARLDALMKRARKPLAPGDPRRHHFLPQFFQRRFADDEERLVVVRVDGGCQRLTHIRNIAVVSDLYTLVDEEVGETVALERVLAEMDAQAAGALQRLVNSTSVPDDSDRGTLACWLAFQSVRDPYTRRTMEALADQVFKLDLSRAAEPEVARARLRRVHGREPTDEEVGEIVDAATHLDEIEVTPHQNDFIKIMLDTGLAMVPHFLRRKIVLLRFREPGLVLCDRPIALRQYDRHRRPGRGFGVIDADEILVPLDRRTAMALHNDPMIGEAIIDDPPVSVDDFNQCIVSNANAEVYCHPADVVRLEALELPMPGRPLIMVDETTRSSVNTDGVNSAPIRKRHRRYRGRQ
jgi:Protein of unknown function (DUF4238)